MSARKSDEQPDLFFTTRARRDDPDTSKAAAARVPHFQDAHHAKILGSIMAQGPGTIYEIGDRVGLDHVQVARRMAELEELEVAEPTGETRLSPTGRQCRVWGPTKRGRA